MCLSEQECECVAWLVFDQIPPWSFVFLFMCLNVISSLWSPFLWDHRVGSRSKVSTCSLIAYPTVSLSGRLYLYEWIWKHLKSFSLSPFPKAATAVSPGSTTGSQPDHLNIPVGSERRQWDMSCTQCASLFPYRCSWSLPVWSALPGSNNGLHLKQKMWTGFMSCF